jgi:RNA 3'-terminal phosphate cyclase (ATP)
VIDIDGSRGEGGGQILRTALALSVITGKPFRMHDIRAGRERPGLQRQHLACVEAAAKLCGTVARTTGIGSETLEFEPHDAWASEISIDIGSAGSTSLVVQTIVVPAIASGRAVRATITGGTHNPLAPPFEFLDRVFVPLLRKMGADVSVAIERHGMMPQGEGRIVLDVRASGALQPITLVDGGRIVASRAIAIVARLPRHVAERELAVAREELDDPTCELRELDDCGPHNVFMVEVERASGARDLVASQGRKGYPAERVAEDALDELLDYVEDDVPVGEHLADQLLLPFAVARGGRFRAHAPLSPHAVTNLGTIREFVSKTELPIRSEPAPNDAVDVIFG